MNVTSDPCDNFYQFACGNYIDEMPIPADKRWINMLSKVWDQLREHLKAIITKERPETDPKHYRLPSDLYKACMNTSLIETLGPKPMEEITKELGGWPVIVGDGWIASTWQKTIKKFRRLGFSISYMFDVDIYAKLDDNTQHIITLDQPSLRLNREYLVNGTNNSFVLAYYDYMVDTAELFGANKTKAKVELMESLLFEIELAKISWPSLERRNSTALYNLHSIKQLQESYPFANWSDLFNGLLSDGLKVNDDEIINLSVPSFFKDLGELLNSTSNRVIANYVMWRIHDRAVDHLSEKFRKRKMKLTTVLTGKQDQGARWKECVDIVTEKLSPAVGSQFVQKHFKPESREGASKMVTDIRNAFSKILKDAQWMDDATKMKAIEKLGLINAQVGYPDELLNDAILKKYYQRLKNIDANNYLNASLTINAFHHHNKFKKLRLPKNRTDWTTFDDPTEVNAFYWRSENSIKFPAGILQGDLFNISRPKYMNYGGMGYVIGHEITHAFDDRGSLYDGNGNLLDWWQNVTRNAYLERVKCMIEQYSNYTDQQTGLKVNGNNTKGENIADNGGIKESYLAYTQWLEINGEELKLPGLQNYTSRQMFWISAAQIWCAKHRNETLTDFITTGVHAPSEFRVLGPFSNMKSFSSDFQCAEGTPMNPKKKCGVW